MPIAVINWKWEEAFDKFGFNDGDGTIFTDDVASYLGEIGFKVKADSWSIHNTIISSIMKGGVEQIPEDATIGYDCPRSYLPAKIVKALDVKFPEDKEV